MTSLDTRDRVARVVKDFHGDLRELEKALGMYAVAPYYGWKVLYLVHDKKTIAKYEDILGISIREECHERGPLADRSAALMAADKLGNFWKAVKGDAKGVRKPDV